MAWRKIRTRPRPVLFVAAAILAAIHLFRALGPSDAAPVLATEGTQNTVTQVRLNTPHLAICICFKNPNASRWSPRWSQLSNASLHLLLLVLSGDVHPNPGPIKTRRRRRPSLPDCPICTKKVGWSKNAPALRCDSADCNRWFHADCIPGLTRDDYNILEEAGDGNDWHCPTCTLTLPPREERKVPPLHLRRTRGKWKVAEPSAAGGSSASKSTPHMKRCGSTKKLPDDVTTLIVNANSLKGKKTQLAALIESTSPHVLIITETKLSNRINSGEIFPSQYSIIRKDRNSKGGGVCIAVSNELDGYEVETVKSEREAVYVLLHSRNQPPTLIGSIYRPPDNHLPYLKAVLDELKQIIATTQPAHILIGGDFNMPGVRWQEGRVPPGTPHRKQAKLLLATMQHLNLSQMVDVPTRERNILDLLFTDSPTLITNVSTAPGLRDHFVVQVEHKLRADINKKKDREVFQYGKADWDRLRGMATIFSTDYAKANASVRRSIADNWLAIKSFIHDAMSACIPKKKVGTRFHLPYITPAIKRKIRLRQRIFHQARKKGNVGAVRDECKRLRKEINTELRSAHHDYLNRMFDPSGDSPGAVSSKRFYAYIKSLRMDSFGVGTLKVGGKVSATSEEKAQACNNQFQSAFSEEDTTTPMPTPTGDPLPSMNDVTITTGGVAKLLHDLNPSKATGPDELPTRVLKEIAAEIAPAISAFFQQSLDEGQLPDDWKQQSVHPIFKKGSRADPANYRPVALTCILCKCLEHVVSSSIHRHLDTYGYLSPNQHGFRRFRSCETQLLETTNDLARTFEDGGITDAIVLDFSKAFDKIPHQRLLRKLQHCGITGQAHKWIENFLVGRRQRVVIDGDASQECGVASGVPQGSVLGPLLFIVFINDIGSGVSQSSRIRLFADDALLYRRIDDLADHVQLQADLDSLSLWADTWCMSFNAKKCYALHIMSRHQRRHHVSIPYHLCGQELARVSDTPYLGVTINDNLSWTPHTEIAVAKAHTSISFLQRNLRMLPQYMRERAYFTIVRPALEYACSITDPPLQSDISRLDRVQRHAARFVTNNPRKRYDPDDDIISVTSLLEGLQWPTLQSRRRAARCTLLYKVLNDLVAVSPELKPETTHRTTRSSTRSSTAGNIAHIRSRTDVHDTSFFPKTIRDWNRLPSAAKTASSLEGFKASL